MNETVKYSVFILLFVLLGTGCEQEIVYEESREIGSIYVGGITGNTIHLYTGGTFRVELERMPPDALPEGTVLYTYKSGNNRFFTVDADGLIRGVSPGEALLYVTSPNYPDLKTMAMVSVTDQRFPVTEIKVDERLKNLSMGVGDLVAVGAYITILPENASDKEYSLVSSDNKILTVTESGGIRALALGNAVLTIKANDGSGVSATCNISVKEPAHTPLDRSAWTVTVSHDLPEDAAIKNAPESLIDGNNATCLSMVKPGKNYAGINVGADEDIFFVIDMKEKTTFNYFKIYHRTSNTQPYLRVWGVSLFGSDDGDSFTPIAEKVPIEYDGVRDYTVRMPESAGYRYLKVQYTQWNAQSGSTIQMAEFELGVFGF